MKHFWKINIYEIHAILYWILGFLIIHLGDWQWIGWISVGYGWFTYIFCIFYSAKHRSELKDYLKKHD